MDPFDSFYQSYVATALWTSTDEVGSYLDGGDAPLSGQAQAAMLRDCQKFWETWGTHIEDPSRAGHDFWLTRNRHGAGFWDGDWPEPLATQLTQSSHNFGEVNLYVGDDGDIYHARA